MWRRPDHTSVDVSGPTDVFGALCWFDLERMTAALVRSLEDQASDLQRLTRGERCVSGSVSMYQGKRKFSLREPRGPRLGRKATRRTAPRLAQSPRAQLEQPSGARSAPAFHFRRGARLTASSGYGETTACARWATASTTTNWPVPFLFPVPASLSGEEHHGLTGAGGRFRDIEAGFRTLRCTMAAGGWLHLSDGYGFTLA